MLGNRPTGRSTGSTSARLGKRSRRCARWFQYSSSSAHLRSALETFTDLGAAPLVARAAQELRASGETARKRDPSTVLDLTPMERKVAQLVSTGLSNKDVAARCDRVLSLHDGRLAERARHEARTHAIPA